MGNKTLYVITCISNPVRYKTRYDLYRKFAKHVRDSGAELYTAEMAFGARDFSITEPDNPNHIQVRSHFELWQKENLLNITMRALPADWEYVAWVDADITFTRPDWVAETVEQLQHYQIVQMFSHAQDLGPNHEPMKLHTGYIHDWYHGRAPNMQKGYAKDGHPGYAWAARREAIDAVGGLIEHGILGSGDTHMAYAMLGKVDKSYNPGIHDNYKQICHEWQARCEKHVRRDLGYVAGTINHYWHGSKANRHYNDRWKILVEHQYDPFRDTYRDSQGLLVLNDEKIGLRDDIRKYFRSRAEDCTFTGDYKLIP